jgi:ABC-type nickel/cobalt efflux system permease component RcnA
VIDYAALSMSFIASTALYTWWSERRAHKKTEKFAEKMCSKVHELRSQLKEEKSVSGPYRDAAEASATWMPPPPATSRLYPYTDWSKQSIYLECPMCGMKVQPKACSCTEHLEPHTHSDCPECKYHFAMQGRRTRTEKEEEK